MIKTYRHQSDPGASTRRPPVIGFLVDRLDDSYQNKCLAALVTATEELGASLICFCAGPVVQRRDGAERHHSFHLATPENIDALIVSTPTLVSAIGQEALVTQIARFKGKPVVSMGAELDGAASIMLDNADAMRRITRHLLEEHGCERVACIRGPASNSEAAERFQGYLSALAEMGRQVAPDLVVEGDFHPESGARAIVTLLDQRRVSFDALVVANDEMAVSAIHQLQERGIHIPGDVKVTGFDDDVAAQYELPSLSTIRQRVTTFAREAVKLALTGIEIDVSQRRHLLRTELVIRRSCGCPLERAQFSVTAPKRPEHAEHEPPLIQKRPELCRDMMNAASDLLSEEHANRLLDGFFAGLMNKSVTAFVESWDAVLREALQRDVELRQYQAVTTALRWGAVPPLVQFPGMLLRAETMLHEARVLLTNVVHQRATQRQLQEKRLTNKLCEVAQGLIVAEDSFQLADMLSHHLRDLKIPGCCLAVYDPRHAVGARNRVRVILLYREDEALQINASTRFCYESELVSGRFLDLGSAGASIVLPLYFGERKLGIALFDVGTRDGTVYEALRAQISAALEATSTYAEVGAYNRDRDELIARVAAQLRHFHRSVSEEVLLGQDSGMKEGAVQRDGIQKGGIEQSSERPALMARLAELEQAVRDLLETSGEPSTQRAPSEGQHSGLNVSKPRKTSA